MVILRWPVLSRGYLGIDQRNYTSKSLKKKNSNKCLKINFDHELLSQNFNIVLNKPLYLDFVMGIRKLLEKSYPSFLTCKVKL